VNGALLSFAAGHQNIASVLQEAERLGIPRVL
jgi:hypothetical protein